jgi:hypothetical protein
MEAAQVIEPEQVNEVRQLIDELKIGTEQFRKQQTIIVNTYSGIIGTIDQTQEDYGETLKFFLQKVQKEMGKIQSVNASLDDLIHTAAVFGSKTAQTHAQAESLIAVLSGIEGGLRCWSEGVKKEIKSIHQKAGKSVFRNMKYFILANTACTIGIFITMFYFFYRTGIFQQ